MTSLPPQPPDDSGAGARNHRYEPGTANGSSDDTRAQPGRARVLTDGFLPVEAFLHIHPTAIGLLELDRPPVLAPPAPPTSGPARRDALALVRLHGEPLAIVHLPGAPEELSGDALAAAVWEQAADTVQAHCARFGCSRAPGSAAPLLAGLPSGPHGCPGALSAQRESVVTVIVPTGGRVTQLERCLQSIVALDHGRFDVLVVDNRPQTPGTAAVVEAFRDRLAIQYVAEPRPGSSAARNRGIAESRAEFVAFTDDDVVVDPQWLRWLIDPFAVPRVNAVAGMVLPLALDTEAQKRFEQYAGFSKGVVGARYDLDAHRARDRALYPYWGGMFGSGNSMAFRREELAAAGGLDTALGAGSPARAGADIEAFSAAILRGGQLVYQPRSFCWHEHRREYGALRDQLFNYGVGFTAIMTKYATHDPRFLGAGLRSARLLAARARAAPSAAPAALPKSLARRERVGMLQGPLLYAKSRRWARRLGLHEIINGG